MMVNLFCILTGGAALKALLCFRRRCSNTCSVQWIQKNRNIPGQKMPYLQVHRIIITEEGGILFLLAMEMTPSDLALTVSNSPLVNGAGLGDVNQATSLQPAISVPRPSTPTTASVGSPSGHEAVPNDSHSSGDGAPDHTSIPIGDNSAPTPDSDVDASIVATPAVPTKRQSSMDASPLPRYMGSAGFAGPEEAVEGRLRIYNAALQHATGQKVCVRACVCVCLRVCVGVGVCV